MQQGFSASSIQWGAWAGAGMVVQTGTLDQMQQRGMSGVMQEQGMCVFNLAFSQALPAVIGFVPITWPIFLQQYGRTDFFSQFDARESCESDIKWVKVRFKSLPTEKQIMGRADEQAWPLTPMQLAYVAGSAKITGLDGRRPRAYFELECSPKFVVSRFKKLLGTLLQEVDICRTFLQPGPQGTPLWHTLPANHSHVHAYQPNLVQVPAMQQEYWREFRRYNNTTPDFPSSWQFPAFNITVHQCAGSNVVSVTLPYELGQHMLLMTLFCRIVRAAAGPTQPEWPTSEFSPAEYMLFASHLRGTQDYEKSKKYWRDRLESLPEPPNLPMLRQRGDDDYVYNLSNLELSSPIQFKNVRSACRRHGVSPTSLFIGTFAAVVSSFCESSEFTIGMLANWEAPEISGKRWPIGPGGRHLMLTAIELKPSDSWQPFLSRINSEIVHNFQHMYYDPAQLIPELKTLWRNQDTVFGVQAPGILDPERSDQLENLRYFMPQTCHVILDAMHWFSDLEKLNKLMYLVADDLIDHTLAHTMMQLQLGAMEALTTDDSLWERPITFEAPPPEAQTDLIMSIPAGWLFDGFFAAACSRPMATAVVSGPLDQGLHLSYGCVADMAIAMAHEIRALSSAGTKLVGVVMDKGWEQVVGVISVQLAGYAYLPISAQYPIQRIKTVLDLGQASVVLTQSWLMHELAWPEWVRCIPLDVAALPTGIKTSSKHRPPLRAQQLTQSTHQQRLAADYEELRPHSSPTSKDLAYVIFTSGTTWAVPYRISKCHDQI